MASRARGRQVVVVGAHSQSLLLRVDRVPNEGETILGWNYEEPLDGGKATNQAVAVAKLGVPVAFVSAFGNDERGARIRRFLEDQRVDLGYAAVTDGATDVGFVMLPESGVPAIVTATGKSDQIDKTFVERAAAALREASCVLAQLEAPQEAAVAAFEVARAAGALTVLNPAPAALLDDHLLALTDILVPNEHEAAFLAGRDAPVAELAAGVRATLKVPTVIVTAGAQGAYVASDDAGVVHVGAPQVEACDTTGAGDAFIGALASRIHERWPLLDAVRFAVLYAAKSVTRTGTLPAYPTLEEMADDLAAVHGES